jgi:hypothetical protein
MISDPKGDDALADGGWFGWRASGLTLALHLAGLVLATWPLVLTFPFEVPANSDVIGGLWLLRWYRTCLLGGGSVFFCPEIMHPAGVPMGFFTPLYLQSVLFTLCAGVSSNDVVCWNIVWLIGMLGTGMGTALLAWRLIGDRASAAFAGLMAMLSTPMMVVALAQLELVYVGGFPLFLIAWMRFVDRPSLKWMAASALGYLLVAMSSGYYMVFAVFPAALYLLWGAIRAGWREVWPWLRCRLPWLFGVVGAMLPGLLLVYSAQIWMFVHGYSVDRSRAEFELFPAPLWSYAVPSPWQRLGALLPNNPYWALGVTAPARMSYLGVVTIGLMVYAAVSRARLRRASFVWVAFALMVVLSLGASQRVGGWQLSLPAGWLWAVFPPIRITRVICRFSMFAMILGGVISASGLRHLLARLPGPFWRASVFTGLALIAVADLSLSQLRMLRTPLPTPPGCYAFLQRHDPKGAILEIPEVHHCQPLNAICSYWQSHHRLTTSAGLTGLPNHAQDGRIHYNSPFLTGLLENPHYLETPERFFTLVIREVDFREYLWLYLTVNRFEYIVLHKGEVPLFGDKPPATFERVKKVLEDCKIYEDEKSIVYARSRLDPPSQVVAINTGAWSPMSIHEKQWSCVVPRTTPIVVYNPQPDVPFQVVLGAAIVTKPLTVRLLAGDKELARWDVETGQYKTCASPRIQLPAGLNELTIESDRPYRIAGARRSPKGLTEAYQLRIATLFVRALPKPVPVAKRELESPAARDTRVR